MCPLVSTYFHSSRITYLCITPWLKLDKKFWHRTRTPIKGQSQEGTVAIATLQVGIRTEYSSLITSFSETVAILFLLRRRSMLSKARNKLIYLQTTALNALFSLYELRKNLSASLFAETDFFSTFSLVSKTNDSEYL